MVEGARPGQATLARAVTAGGPGLHGGRFASVTLVPAPVGHGVRFRVVGPDGCGETRLCWRHRVASRMNTALGLPDGGRLRTVEHLAATLAAYGVDNVLVTVEGDEIPIFDGSARRWCELLDRAGLARQAAPRRVIEVLRPIQVTMGDRMVRLEPADSLELDVTCRHGWTGARQRWRGAMSRDVFVEEVAGSRSSGRLDALWNAGPLRRTRLGSWLRAADRKAARPAAEADGLNRPCPDLAADLPEDLQAAVRLDPGEPSLRGVRPGRVAMLVGPWTLGGARYPDELVRHYTLDLLGDLSLIGAPIRARVVANEPTHRLTFVLAAMLHRQPDRWREIVV